jgi:hypothetical protein
VIGALMSLAFLAGLRSRPAALLVRVEQQVAGLRSEVASYRVAQEHLVASIARRLEALEGTTATAMVEVRLASHAVLSQPGFLEATSTPSRGADTAVVLRRGADEPRRRARRWLARPVLRMLPPLRGGGGVGARPRSA